MRGARARHRTDAPARPRYPVDDHCITLGHSPRARHTAMARVRRFAETGHLRPAALPRLFAVIRRSPAQPLLDSSSCSGKIVLTLT